MNAPNYSAAINICGTKRNYYYNKIVVLTLSTEYPNVLLPCGLTAQAFINREISAQLRDFYGYVSGEIYREAVDIYNYTQENGYPFNRFEAVMNYEITYNQQCHLSLYRDRYTYQGGAHGNTVRNSDNWNLNTGRRLPLASFFPPGQDYRAFLIEEIRSQADDQMQQNPGLYFDDYRMLIEQNFNEES
jgi:hypothetical protein